MSQRIPRLAVAALLAAAPLPALAQSPADTTRPAVNTADVRFMSGMIHHHAQAILMARWAPSHGASSSIQTLCARIIISQNDEIALMQHWLAAHHQPVPAVDTMHAMMPEMDPGAMMPGMLSAAQLSQLDAARGTDFDRLFLTFMIQHHNGAITMVNQLFASGIYADQTTEIARMQKMLAAIILAP